MTGHDEVERLVAVITMDCYNLALVVFAPDTAAGWIHAAYRRRLGLVPHPAAVPGGWKPSWL